MNLLTFRGTVSTFHREEVERRTNGGYTEGGGGGEYRVLAPSCLVQTSAWPKIIAIVERR